LKRLIIFFNQALIFVIFFLGMWFTVLKVFGNNFNFIPGGIGDASFTNYILEHFFRRVLGLDGSYWNSPFFYPFPYTTAFSENFLGSAPLYLLFRWIGLDRESAFQGWYALGYVLNYVSALFVLWRLSLKPLPAAIGAFFFTFGLPMLAQEGHTQLLYRFPVPLTCFLLWRFYLEPRMRTFFFLVVFFVWQFYMSIYLGVFLLLLLAAMALILTMRLDSSSLIIRVDLKSLWKHLIFWPKKITTAWLRSPIWERIIAPILIVCLCLGLVFLLTHYSKISKIYGFKRDWSEVESMLPRLKSFFLADQSLLWGPVSHLFPNFPMRHEHQLFPGFTILILIVLGLVWQFKSDLRKIAFVHLWAAIFLIILTLDINGFTFYQAVAWLPGLNSIRAVTRLQLVLMWPMALFAACVLDALLSKPIYREIFYLLVYLSAALMITETASYRHSTYSKIAEEAKYSGLLAQLPKDIPENPILFLGNKSDIPWYETEVDGMLLAQDLGWPSLNGYSGNVPPNYAIADSCVQLPKRIINYMKFANITDESFYIGMMKRVVPLGFTDCDPNWWKSEGSISP
jgi:hypothetical protein